MPSIIISLSYNFFMDTLLIIYLPVLWLILHITTKHILYKLKNLPPSPFPSLPLIGHLYLLKKPYHRALSKVSKRYGPVLFLQFGSRPVIIVSSPSLAEECFTKNDIIFANRPSLLTGKHFGYNWTSLVWAPYGEHWRNLRKISTVDLLSSHRLQMLSHVRADEIQILIRKLVRLAGENPDEIVYVKRALFEFIFNVMTRMICGKRYFGEGLENSKQARDFQDVLTEIGKVIPDTQILDVLPFMRWFGFGDTEKKLMQVQEKRNNFMQNVIEEHGGMETDASSTDKKTVAQVLLDKQKEDPTYYTDEMIRNLLLVLLQAGTDTTATVLEWAFTFLLENRDALQRAQIEIDNLVGKKRLINESDLGQLTYLHCIIDETMRMRIPTPLLFPREASADCTVGGYHVPRGTILLVNAWGIQLDSEYWEEPEKFKPERFGDFGKGRNGCKFLPFGSGRRACPAENMAVRVVALALGTLIQCFDWGKVSETDLNEAVGFSAPKIQPLTARCSPRLEIVNLLSQI